MKVKNFNKALECLDELGAAFAASLYAAEGTTQDQYDYMAKISNCLYDAYYTWDNGWQMQNAETYKQFSLKELRVAHDLITSNEGIVFRSGLAKPSRAILGVILTTIEDWFSEEMNQ